MARKRSAKKQNAAPKPAKPRDPRHIFINAEKFHNAAEYLHQLPGTLRWQMMTPTHVCGAFALELYLKCLITIEGKRFGLTHDHQKLFQELSANAQDAIRKRHKTLVDKFLASPGVVEHAEEFIDKIPGKSMAFDNLLFLSKDAFKLFRYAFDVDDVTKLRWLSSDIVIALRDYIIATYPAVAAPNPPGTYSLI